ncbi:MAG TPA: AAA family ATPase [Phycisphaerae bacterium]|nr:AAA family ATPase [Phycisphaerae bacterium]
MYLAFYNLREFPFAMGCDVRFFYESSVHAEALANMLYTFQQRKGMVLISGEVGAGKTFVGNLLICRLGPGCQAVMLRHPPQSGKQMLRALAGGLGIRVPTAADKLDLVDRLQQHLLRMFHRGRLVALILDECQDLSTGVLEEIRLLWNWEQDGQRLVQILLIGQPELREKLQEPKWESLRQRIVLSYHLGHLSADDTDGYIRRRLKVAANGGHGQADFTPQAIAEIHCATDGIPRLINVLTDNSLLVGYAKGVHCIDRLIVREVLRDMTCWGLRTPPAEIETTEQALTRTGA